MSNQQLRREARERAAFLEFAKICPLRIDRKSIASLPPPHPDIYCRIIELGEVGFELVEIVDEGMARSESEAIRTGGAPSAGSYSDRDPLINQISGKLTKDRYDPLARLELLAYITRIPADFRRSTWTALHEVVSSKLAASPFERVWVHSQVDRSLIFVEPPEIALAGTG